MIYSEVLNKAQEKEEKRIKKKKEEEKNKEMSQIKGLYAAQTNAMWNYSVA